MSDLQARLLAEERRSVVHPYERHRDREWDRDEWEDKLDDDFENRERERVAPSGGAGTSYW